ncbi:MAG TPA: membrane dipeptidase [Niabella sp.]|nr:membrane dipeptidase [Niabella sp.]HRC09369.1 membrane dipeptidase [Niabella sp.]
MKVKKIAALLNDLFGGPFDSQSSPTIVSQSPLQIGVVALLALEHAFTREVLQVFGIDLSKGLPVDWDMFERIKTGETDYYTEFKKQADFYLTHQKALEQNPFNIYFLTRKQCTGMQAAEIKQVLQTAGKRFMCFSIEGGHNLSNAPIKQEGASSDSPELQLKEIQEHSKLDFISLNLCHLSEIPEQLLGGFAQGLTSQAQIAFKSDDFIPKNGFGLSALGKKVVKQALTHSSHPILIDVKHMSIYTRLDYYKYRKALIKTNSEVSRLPIISSHTGFVFLSLKKLLDNKLFLSETSTDNGISHSQIKTLNQLIGETEKGFINEKLYSNPWSINLYDEDIEAIFESRGMIGISLDQRILGASKMLMDGNRKAYFDAESISFKEWEKLFREGQFPISEEEEARAIAPSREERHIMLLCTHIVYAVRMGYEKMAWSNDESPWNHICIGSDYDGLINPINGYNTMSDLKKLEAQLRRYLPVADNHLKIKTNRKAFEYDTNGKIKSTSLEAGIQKFLFTNGLNFITRFLKNWN